MTDAARRPEAFADLTHTTAGWRKPNGQPNYPSGEAPLSTHWGKAMESLEQIGGGVIEPPPPPPPPSGSRLRWAPPALVSPVVFDLTNATRTSSTLSNGQGRDLLLRCQEVLNGGLGLLSGWRNIVWIGGEMVDMSSASSSGHVVPQNNSGTLHFEGIKANVAGDFFGCRFTNPIIQIQNCDISVSDLGTTAHADCFQTQYLTCDELRCDTGTFRTDYQGFFVSNEQQISGQPAPSKVGKFLLSRWNFKPGPQGPPATYFFKAIPSRALPLGPWTLEDVWLPDDPQIEWRVMPNHTGVDWKGDPVSAKCSVGTDAQGKYLSWNVESGIAGKARVGAHADFAQGAGMNYVSPGYV
jgi:hypothetical protein